MPAAGLGAPRVGDGQDIRPPTRWRSRMSIESIDIDACTGCGICIDSCCMDVLRIDAETGKAAISYPDDCVHQAGAEEVVASR